MHATVVDVPSQRYPATHAAQVVRVFASAPPDVWNPSAHVAQVAAPTAENFLSLPHAVVVLVPSQLYPALHRSQDVRLTEVQAPVPAAHDV